MKNIWFRKSLICSISFMLVFSMFAFVSINMSADSPDFSVVIRTLDDPYEISNVTQLQNIKDDLYGHYILINDIDASETSGWNDGDGFMPIGNNSENFYGTLDGQGFDIINLFINRSVEFYVGLFGISRGLIINVSLTDVYINGFSFVGGLVGYTFESVLNCSVTGEVNGHECVGGLVGRKSGVGSISNCYAQDSVGGGDNVGGLVGRNYGYISNCYSSGYVSGNHYVGGFIGENQNVVMNSFWDYEASGQTEGVGWGFISGVIGKNTSEMKTKSTFTNAGWDFINIWDIDEGITYPFFIWQRNDLPIADFTYTPENPTTDDLIQFTDTSFDPDGEIVSWWWDFGDGYLSVLQNPVHQYYDEGEYEVSLTVTDDYGAEVTTFKIITVILNQAPGEPDITGPLSGNAGVEYDYHFVSEDLDDDDIYYYIDWDDGTVEDWFGPFDSGEEVVVSHVWEEVNTYVVKAKAKDIYDAESDWGYLPIEIPRNKVKSNSLFVRLLERFLNAFPFLR